MMLYRQISLSTHGAVEIALGAMLVFAPLPLMLETVPTVLIWLAGSLLIAMSFASHLDEDSPHRQRPIQQQRPMPITLHAILDYGVSAGMIVAGIYLLGASEMAAALILGVAGLLQGLLTASTRYSSGSV